VSGAHRGDVKRMLMGLVEAGVCVVMVFSLLGMWGGHHWMLDLLSHFRLQYFWALVLGAIILGMARCWRWCMISVGMVVVLGMTMGRFYLPVPREVAGETLKLISFNVHTSNDRHDEVISFLRAEDADVVFLMEVNRDWGERLRALDDVYPYRLSRVREDNFGVFFLSKVPFKEGGVRYFGVAEVPSIEAVTDWSERELRIVGTHPVPPVGREGSRLRNDQLDVLNAHLSGDRGQSVLLAGDFNVTPFSPHYGGFLEGTGLRDAALGFGLKATWNRRFPWVAIPIDHVFVSEDVVVLERRIGEACGSDHHPVVVTLGWRS
jgi:endonuclease/exonuclease/phosphatase (EEP) superfamily protein YafD